MLNVSLSIYKKSISAPQFIAQLAEATKVFGTVQTKSPFLIPKAKQAICSALDPLLTATEYLDPQNLLILFSNFFTSGP